MHSFRALCVALTLCGAAMVSVASQATDHIADDRLRELAAVVQGFVDTEEVVGAELLVMQGRRVALHEGFGWMDRERGIPMEPDTLFNIRSMTKPMTGSLALMLIDDGRLAYEGKVSEHNPAFATGRSAEITIDHLLTHRSGLPMSLLKGFPGGSLYEIAEEVGKHGPDHTPGEAFHYSDSGSDTLGAVVEAAAGQQLAELFRARLFEPLGMTDAHAPLGDAEDAGRPVATAYVMQEGAWTPYWTDESPPLYAVAMGAQGVHATPREYARFLQMWLDEGHVGGTRVLSAEAVERALEPVSNAAMPGIDAAMPTGFADVDVRYGRMWLLWTRNGADEVVAFGHGGSDGTSAWAWPERDLIVVYCTQSRGNVSGITLERHIQRLLIDQADGAEAAPTPALSAYAGTYVSRFSSRANQEIEVIVQDDGLALRTPFGAVVPLLPEDEDGRRALAYVPTQAVSFDLGPGEALAHGLWMHDPVAMYRDATDDPPVDGDGSLQSRIGTYIVTGQNLTFRIERSGDTLTLLTPGGSSRALAPADDEGRWVFDDSENECVTFQSDDGGTISGMTLHQAHRFVRGTLPAEATMDPESLEKYLGFYVNEQAGHEVEVLVHKDRLAVKLPTLPTALELRAPDAEGKWALRLNPMVSMRFNEDEKGAVVSYTAFAGGEELLRPRVEPPVPSQPE